MKFRGEQRYTTGGTRRGKVAGGWGEPRTAPHTRKGGGSSRARSEAGPGARAEPGHEEPRGKKTQRGRGLRGRGRGGPRAAAEGQSGARGAHLRGGAAAAHGVRASPPRRCLLGAGHPPAATARPGAVVAAAATGEAARGSAGPFQDSFAPLTTPPRRPRSLPGGGGRGRGAEPEGGAGLEGGAGREGGAGTLQRRGYLRHRPAPPPLPLRPARGVASAGAISFARSPCCLGDSGDGGRLGAGPGRPPSLSGCRVKWRRGVLRRWSGSCR